MQSEQRQAGLKSADPHRDPLAVDPTVAGQPQFAVHSTLPTDFDPAFPGLHISESL
jgi:hypothetical protein